MGQSKYKIAILLPYFGKWPEWILLFFETLKKNNTIDFIFFTDCDTSVVNAPNIIFYTYTFQEYIDRVKDVTGINFNPANPYKLCDIRPLYGIIHQKEIANYDFFGWTDVDILFGDIRSFYTDDILDKYDVLSTHQIRISGHLTLLKNTQKNLYIYKKIYKWKEAVEKPNFVGIDEHGITNAFSLTILEKIEEKFNVKLPSLLINIFKKIKTKRIYFKEQYTTPFTSIPWLDGTINSNQPNVWYYKNGAIYNDRDIGVNFIYLHFMNFKSSTYRHDNTKAPWEGKETICFASVNDMIKRGLIINNNGINPIHDY